MTDTDNHQFLLLAFKSINGIAPRYLSELLQPYVPAESLLSSNKSQLANPKCSLSTYDTKYFHILLQFYETHYQTR